MPPLSPQQTSTLNETTGTPPHALSGRKAVVVVEAPAATAGGGDDALAVRYDALVELRGCGGGLKAWLQRARPSWRVTVPGVLSCRRVDDGTACDERGELFFLGYLFGPGSGLRATTPPQFFFGENSEGKKGACARASFD